MCDKCIWNHDNYKDVMMPNHCKCECHTFRFGIVGNTK